jgi:hypothetical protein
VVLMWEKDIHQRGVFGDGEGSESGNEKTKNVFQAYLDNFSFGCNNMPSSDDWGVKMLERTHCDYCGIEFY